MPEHYTVKVEIFKVVDVNKSNTPTCRCLTTQTCHHAKPDTERRSDQVVNVVTRVDDVGEAGLDRAISKAVKHLDCERP